MAYTGLIDKVKIFNLNLNEELDTVMNLISNINTTYGKILKDPFYYQHFPLRKYTTSYDEFLKKHFYPVMYPKYINDPVSEEKYLLACDLLKNLFFFVLPNMYIDDSFKAYALMILEKCDVVMSKLGYKFTFDESENVHIIIEINPLAEHIAKEIKNTEIEVDIYNFLVYNISNKEKEGILVDLYKQFEKLRKKNKTGQAGEILAKLLNNGLRHDYDENNIPEIKEIIKARPNIYDEAFSLLIQSFYHSINSEIIDIIKPLHYKKSKKEIKKEI